MCKYSCNYCNEGSCLPKILKVTKHNVRSVGDREVTGWGNSAGLTRNSLQHETETRILAVSWGEGDCAPDSQHQEENPGCKSKSMNLVSSGAVPLTCNRWMDVPLLTEGANIWNAVWLLSMSVWGTCVALSGFPAEGRWVFALWQAQVPVLEKSCSNRLKS